MPIGYKLWGCLVLKAAKAFLISIIAKNACLWMRFRLWGSLVTTSLFNKKKYTANATLIGKRFDTNSDVFQHLYECVYSTTIAAYEAFW